MATTERFRGRLLVVDDSPPGLAALLEYLDAEGFDVFGAEGGHEALARARREAPELILLDLLMPDLGGFDVCRALKADPATAGIPVIFMTALDRIEDKIRGFAVGGVDFVIKPLQPAEVVARVVTHVTLRRLERSLAAQNEALRREVEERREAENRSALLVRDLEVALARVRRLSGLLPICAGCKKIRDDDGYWQQVEVYVGERSDAEFSHGLCPDCKVRLYPESDYPFLYSDARRKRGADS